MHCGLPFYENLHHQLAYLLPFGLDHVLHLHLLHLLVIRTNRLRNFGLGDSKANNLDAWRPRPIVLLECFDQPFVHLIELIHRHLPHRIFRAEFVHQVVHFVLNEHFVVAARVVLNCLIGQLHLQLRNYFHLLKTKQHAR